MMNEQTADAFVSFARQVAEDEATWADWHNRVFGVDGRFQELFPTEDERRDFFDSVYAGQIERLERLLREGKAITEYTWPVTTASGKFVVRLPQSLHLALTREAREEGVSLNQLILSKLAVSLKAAVSGRSTSSVELSTN